jgi:hypothetical protein
VKLLDFHVPERVEEALLERVLPLMRQLEALPDVGDLD